MRRLGLSVCGGAQLALDGRHYGALRFNGGAQGVQTLAHLGQLPIQARAVVALCRLTTQQAQASGQGVERIGRRGQQSQHTRFLGSGCIECGAQFGQGAMRFDETGVFDDGLHDGVLSK